MRGFPRKFGPYELLEEVARGAMGVVYRARQVGLDRTVALKTILPGRLSSAVDLDRFDTEARAAARLRHPGIVPVHDVGVHEDQPYYSMDFIEGCSLATKIDDGPLESSFAVGVVRQVAEAVHAAHEQGVLHRDLKPSNLLLDDDGRAWVTDFGLAKILESESGSSMSGDVIGTASYMAPEQAEGRSEDVGPRSDVYSLGAVLYALISGRPPFVGPSTVTTLRAVVEREPLPLSAISPEVPAAIATICHKCLHKNPARRYASAVALAEDLRRWERREPILARPVGLVERAVLWAQRRPSVATLGLLLVLAVGTGFFGVVWLWREAVLNLDRVEEERRARHATRMEAMFVSEPLALPSLLNWPEERREEWSPLVRDRLAGSSGWEALCLRLVLLPEEPGPFDWGPVMVAQGDVRRMLAARDGFVKRASVDTWDALKVSLRSMAANGELSPDDSFRVSALQARLDPDALHGEDNAGRILQALEEVSPFHRRAWLDAFVPASEALVRAVVREHRSASRDSVERDWLALMLGQFAAGRPESLLQGLVDGDAQSFQALWPALEELEEQVVRAALEARLAEPLLPEREVEWPTYPAPDSRWVQTIEQAGGRIEPGWAYAPAVAEDLLGELLEGLRPAGYRPIRVRVDRPQAAVVWTRDDRDWEVDFGLDLDEAREFETDYREEGFDPLDVVGWVPEGGEFGIDDLCAIVWRERRAVDSQRILRLAEPLDDEVRRVRGGLEDPRKAPGSRYELRLESDEIMVYAVDILRADHVDRLVVEEPAPDESRLDGTHDSYVQVDTQFVRATAGRGEQLSFVAEMLPDRESSRCYAMDAEVHREITAELVEAGCVPTCLDICEGRVISVWHRSIPSEPERDARASALANARLAWVRLTGDASVLTEPAKDPVRVEAHVIQRAMASGIGRGVLEELYRQARDSSVRRLALLCLRQGPGVPEPSPLVSASLRSADAAERAAARTLASSNTRSGVMLPASGDGWFLAADGLTMVVMRGNQSFSTGSIGGDPDRLFHEFRQRTVIPRDFALSSTEVSWRQLREYSVDTGRLVELVSVVDDERIDEPVAGINWIEAVAYCRWLSKREGFAEEDIPYRASKGTGGWAKPNFLSCRGYRLPTEAEWEFGARAGTDSARSFGGAPELVGDYGWSRGNTGGGTRAVATLLPNPVGMFDIYGNVWEWCHDTFKDFMVQHDVPIRVDNEQWVERAGAGGGGEFRGVRGGSFDTPIESLRSASRRRVHEEVSARSVGFRLARTVYFDE